MADQTSLVQSVMENLRSNIDAIRTSIASTRTSIIGTRSDIAGRILERFGKKKSGGILGMGILPMGQPQKEEETQTTTQSSVTKTEMPSSQGQIEKTPTQGFGFMID